MGSIDFRKYWNAFIHWPGWRAFGQACARGWRAFIRWNGWGKVFFLPAWTALALFILCGGALIWVFATDRVQWWPAYILYGLSAYALTSLCVNLPKGLRSLQNWLVRHPKLAAMLKNSQRKFTFELYMDQMINFAYGIFKIISGVVIGSAWIGCDGIYNFTQSIIQLYQILRRKNAKTLEQQWKSYRNCGVLVCLMHLTLIGIVFQMVNWNRVEESGEIMLIATAAFAFYKFISAFIKLAKDRKHKHPIDSSVRMLSLCQAIFAIFSLQAGLLHTFGTGEAWEHWMNLAMGCLVCLLTVATGIYMIRRSNREIKQLQENKHGK